MSNLKEPGIPGYYLLIVFSPIIFLLIWIMHYYNQDHVDNAVWKKEPTFVISAKVNKIFSASTEKGGSYWTYADLDNGDLLINPWHGNMLCHILTAPRDNTLVQSYEEHKLDDAIESGNKVNLSVKKIPSTWVKDNQKDAMKEDCPHVDFSGAYVTYRGRAVVELITLSD
jgi:hypothetical protein